MGTKTSDRVRAVLQGWERYGGEWAQGRHPLLPWWCASTRPVLGEQVGAFFGSWERPGARKGEGPYTVSADDVLNGPPPLTRIALDEMMEIDRQSPQPQPDLAVGQVWIGLPRASRAWPGLPEVGGGWEDGEHMILRVERSVGGATGYYLHGLRVGALDQAATRNAALLAGPGAPWAPRVWGQWLRDAGVLDTFGGR